MYSNTNFTHLIASALTGYTSSLMDEEKDKKFLSGLFEIFC